MKAVAPTPQTKQYGGLPPPQTKQYAGLCPQKLKLPEESSTLYRTIPTFNKSKEGGFGKHCGKRRNCW